MDGPGTWRTEGPAPPAPTCPHCGSSRFYVIVDTRSTTEFSLGRNGKGMADAVDICREYGETRWFQNVYCSECGKVAGKRDEMEAAGWPIPI